MLLSYAMENSLFFLRYSSLYEKKYENELYDKKILHI
jgi:hypothetical protein